MDYRVLKGNLGIQAEGQTICPKVGDIVKDPIGAEGLVERGGIEPIATIEPVAEKPKPKRGRPKKEPEAE